MHDAVGTSDCKAWGEWTAAGKDVERGIIMKELGKEMKNLNQDNTLQKITVRNLEFHAGEY
jgi:hypothetical protein